MLGFRYQGLLTQGNETGTRQIAKFGARITPGNKGSNPTNNRGRMKAVVEPLRLPFRDALQSILIRSNYLMQHPTQTPTTGENRSKSAQRKIYTPTESTSIASLDRQQACLLNPYISDICASETLELVVDGLRNLGVALSLVDGLSLDTVTPLAPSVMETFSLALLYESNLLDKGEKAL